LKVIVEEATSVAIVGSGCIPSTVCASLSTIQHVGAGKQKNKKDITLRCAYAKRYSSMRGVHKQTQSCRATTRHSLISLNPTPSSRISTPQNSILEETNMAPQSTCTGTPAAAGTTSLHPRLTPRDKLRLVLFFATPIYARLFLSASIWSAFWHIYIIGSTGVCIVHFTNGIVSLDEVWKIVSALATSSLPSFSQSFSLIAWFVPDLKGWRGTVIHYACVAITTIYLLPETYGSDVQVRKTR
jgi:hypothetical protein